MGLGKFHHDLTTFSRSPGNDGECKGIHPQMAELFRLVKDCNLLIESHSISLNHHFPMVFLWFSYGCLLGRPV